MTEFLTRPVLARARSLLDLAWPGSCAGCARWGPVLCAACTDHLDATTPRRLVSHPIWLGGRPVLSAAVFDGPLRHAITAYKDEGRRELENRLAALLRFAVAHAVADHRSTAASASNEHLDRWQYVVVPSAPAATRRRGWFPLGALAGHLDGPGLGPGPTLRLRRRVRDQSGLSRQERQLNVAGAYALAPAGRRSLGPAGLDGVGLVLVDDVVTTGASLAAAGEALGTLRPAALVAATIAVAETSVRPVRRSTVGAEG